MKPHTDIAERMIAALRKKSPQGQCELSENMGFDSSWLSYALKSCKAHKRTINKLISKGTIAHERLGKRCLWSICRTPEVTYNTDETNRVDKCLKNFLEAVADGAREAIANDIREKEEELKKQSHRIEVLQGEKNELQAEIKALKKELEVKQETTIARKYFSFIK